MLLLGIDTSCDDTSCAVVADGQTVLSNVISSQNEYHGQFGGVVPEIASRRHVVSIEAVLREALDRAGCSRGELDGVAVTSCPGLIGSLVVGIAAAKSLAWAYRKPLVEVNHLQAHVYSGRLAAPELPYPHIALVVSGGHTIIYLVRGPLEMEMLGTTVDDAAGEAFDKVAKLLGLGFPGGPILSRLAADGDPQRYELPRPLLHSKDLDFSFSGLKSAARRIQEEEGERLNLHDFAASVQEAIVEVLLAKTFRAVEAARAQALVIAGGVAANPRLRTLAQQKSDRRGIMLSVPPMSLCADNGAMIAGLGYHLLLAGQRAEWSLNGQPTEYLSGKGEAWKAAL